MAVHVVEDLINELAVMARKTFVVLHLMLGQGLVEQVLFLGEVVLVLVAIERSDDGGVEAFDEANLNQVPPLEMDVG